MPRATGFFGFLLSTHLAVLLLSTPPSAFAQEGPNDSLGAPSDGRSSGWNVALVEPARSCLLAHEDPFGFINVAITPLLDGRISLSLLTRPSGFNARSYRALGAAAPADASNLLLADEPEAGSPPIWVSIGNWPTKLHQTTDRRLGEVRSAALALEPHALVAGVAALEDPTRIALARSGDLTPFATWTVGVGLGEALRDLDRCRRSAVRLPRHSRSLVRPATGET